MNPFLTGSFALKHFFCGTFVIHVVRLAADAVKFFDRVAVLIVNNFLVDEELRLISVLSHYEVYALLWPINFFVRMDFEILRGYRPFGKGKFHWI